VQPQTPSPVPDLEMAPVLRQCRTRSSSHCNHANRELMGVMEPALLSKFTPRLACSFVVIAPRIVQWRECLSLNVLWPRVALPTAMAGTRPTAQQANRMKVPGHRRIGCLATKAPCSIVLLAARMIVSFSQH